MNALSFYKDSKSNSKEYSKRFSKDNQKISKVFFILGKVGKVSGLELTDIILNL